ncbi:DUF4271 domain-containing protein [uncultured Draconibacterium sp.]|uniref:DUF4271 domain-containing protein n=1 Tax=uncultured Draconibacterium sp. TaxID=1573823 RepID=UPI0032179C26
MGFVIYYLCADKEMNAEVTYQQDTVEVQNLLETMPQSNQLNSIPVRQKPVAILSVSERSQTVDTTPQKTYTQAQIRQWRLQQENKLLIDSSKYIAPRIESQLTFSEQNDLGFTLPIHMHNSKGTDWLTFVIFLGILLFASVRFAYAKYMEHMFLSLFNYSTSVRLLQEKNYPIFHGAIRLEIIFYITLSIFIFQTLNVFKWENSLTSLSYFLMILGGVLLYFFGKKLIYLMFGSLFQATQETREYLFNMDNYNRSLGLLLLPIVILVSFAPVRTPVFIVFAGITIFAIVNLILLQRGIFILLKKQFSIFYLFLYLCTLEFLPLLLIYKVVVE